MILIKHVGTKKWQLRKWMPEIWQSWYPMSLLWCRNFSWWAEFFFSEDFRSGRLVVVFQMKFGAGEFGGGNKNPSRTLWYLEAKFANSYSATVFCHVLSWNLGRRLCLRKKKALPAKAHQINLGDKNPWDIWRDDICGILWLWLLVFQSINLMEWSWVTLLVMHHTKVSKVWNSWNLSCRQVSD